MATQILSIYLSLSLSLSLSLCTSVHIILHMYVCMYVCMHACIKKHMVFTDRMGGKVSFAYAKGQWNLQSNITKLVVPILRVVLGKTMPEIQSVARAAAAPSCHPACSQATPDPNKLKP